MTRPQEHLWVNQHRRDQPLPRAVRGEGTFVIDADGKRYLDGSGGPALFCLGHGNEEVRSAIRAQYEAIEFAYSTTFSSEVIEALSAELVDLAGGSLRRITYVSGGSEATDTAMKIALQCQLARGNAGRTHFIARRQSWHGYTLGALSLSGHPARRRPYEAALMPVTQVSAANAYRPPPGVSVSQLADWLAEELEQAILRIGADKVAAFFMEPVVGAAGGAVPAPPGYAARVQAVCREHGVLFVADEVMCGVGRCGTWRALAHDDVEPDIMYTAKGLAGGYAPLGAVIMTESVYADIAARFGTLAVGHTYSGHTASCAAALAVQRIIRRDKLVERCASEGNYILATLREQLGEHPHVGDIRGRGLFLAFEIVADRQSREPFPAERSIADRFRETAFADGLICYPSAGTADGHIGDHVLISPPYNIARSETDLMIGLLISTLAKVLG